MDPRLIDDLEDDLIEDIILQNLLQDLRSRSKEKARMRTGISGHEYIHEMLSSGNAARIHQAMRMKPSTFIALRDWLLANTKLRSSERNGGGGVTIEEKLGIFLYIVSRPASNRDAQERFSHSGDTISRLVTIY
jgi:hypothetical protein